MSFYGPALAETLKAEPVARTLKMLEEQGGGPEDLANAIIDAVRARAIEAAWAVACARGMNISRQDIGVLLDAAVPIALGEK